MLLQLVQSPGELSAQSRKDAKHHGPKHIKCHGGSYTIGSDDVGNHSGRETERNPYRITAPPSRTAAALQVCSGAGLGCAAHRLAPLFARDPVQFYVEVWPSRLWLSPRYGSHGE